MDHPDQRADADPALTGHAAELSAEDELRIAFGRVLGFTAAAILLVLGGGILVLVVGALFFGFLYGH
jgi:hypothetical protein